MSDPTEREIRLYLIAPDTIPDGMSSAVERACEAGDVAALLIPALSSGANAIVESAQAAGLAVLSAERDDADSVDGIHFDGGWLRLKAARSALPDAIIGFGGVASRHDGMQAGESGADYIAIGRLLEVEDPLPTETRIDLLEWWQALMTPPVVVRSDSFDDAAEMARAGADFIALAPDLWLSDSATSDVAALQEILVTIAEDAREEVAV